MRDVVLALVMGAVSLSCALYATRFALKGKGPILMSPWIWLSKQELEKTDLEAGYRLAAKVYIALSIVFAMFVLDILFRWEWLAWPIVVITAGIIGYIIVSSFKNKFGKRGD